MPSRTPRRARSDDRTFIDFLSRRSQEQPDRLAYAFLIDGEREGERLTYAQLADRVRMLAGALRERGATGERVLLLLPPGIDYVVALWASLAAGATAVPVYPPRPGRSVHALDSIVADADARFAIGDVAMGLLDPASPLARVRFLGPRDGDPASAVDLDAHGIRPAGLAVLQYTSGSTSVPRGAMMSHANLMASTAALHEATRPTPDDVAVSWLPLYHDMGLFGGILAPMFAGLPMTLMSPLAFLQRPLRWLQAISRLGGTLSGGPNFAYDLCVDAIRADQLAGLDLSSWRLAVNGAEPIRPETIERFSKAFAPAGFARAAFMPLYGLAEAMLVSGAGDARTSAVDAIALARHDVQPPADAATTSLVISCGRPSPGTHVEIVEPETGLPAPDGRVGEIWAAGPSVVEAYWRKPRESRQLLRARLPDDKRRYLRTGDLGFLLDGELHVTGRLKELIIIRGRNYYPVDLERTVEQSHPAVRTNGVAAIGVSPDGSERLGIVAEVRRTSRADPEAVLASIRRALAEEHDLRVSRVALIPEGRLPRTSSGKIQRLSALRSLESGDLRAILDWRQDVQQEPASASPDAEAADLPRRVPTVAGPGADAIAGWLVAHLAARLAVDPSQIDPDAPFSTFGFGSVEATALAGELATWLERPLSPTLTWDYPTIARLARHLAEGDEAPVEQFGGSPQEPIAVVGIGVRFPGAPSLAAFRDLLREGREAIREAPRERLSFDDLLDPNPATPGKAVSDHGGFLDDIDLFDAQFFGISPREAIRMDPQQRLLLEVTQEALEDAGMPPARLAGSATGVFVGIGSFEYLQVQRDDALDRTAIDAYQGTGNAHSIAANRISFLYDLRGPSIAIDTACSSSLVALHLATQSLLTRESDVALAGGVNVILSPDLTIAFSQARMLSPEGRCKSFDAAADGYVRSEGAGVVVLKRLSDARRDHDRVIALVRGTAVNQDGLTSGITAPSGPAQQEVVRTALARAGITADDLGAVEAHGTGTPLGDPIEVNALAQVIGRSTHPERRVWLGSVKANVGHLEMASGMAGLAKAILELSHGEIYPQPGFRELNPHIRMEGTPLAIPTRLEKWPMGPQPRHIGISSFGFGGTNAHVVLEESREAIEPRSHIERPLHIVTLSAKTEGALQRLAQATADAVAADPTLAVEDVAFTANVGRARHLHRAAVVADTADRLRERLERVAAGRTGPGVAVGRRASQQPPIAFLFTGQGAQYAGMGRLLYDTHPAFRAALDRCVALLDAHLDRPLLTVMFPQDGAPDLLAETVYTQPALFALEYALAELWRSWGVVPDVVLGHSVGEYVAACVAGALSLEDATRLIAARGRLMHGLPRTGAMAAVLAPLERVQQALVDEPDVEVSGINAPENVTISGLRESVERVVEALKADGVGVVPLNVSHAFHSPLMEPILDEFEAIAATAESRPLQIAIATNHDGELLAPGATLTATYWRNHARGAVRFADNLRAAHDYGAQIFLEVGPSPTLTGMGRRQLAGENVKWAASLKPGENDWAAILSALATVFTAGREIDWVGFDNEYRRRLVTLPTYPFERVRHWYQVPERKLSTGSATADRGHPLVRSVVGTPLAAVEARLRAESPAWLGDHRVQGAVVVPATIFVELLLSAATERGSGHGLLEDVEFSRALFLGESEHVLQAVATESAPGQDIVRVYGRATASGDAGWTLHASSRIGVLGEAGAGDGTAAELDAATARCTAAVDVAEFYRALTARGLEYGPAFRGVRELSRGDGEAIATIEAPEAIAAGLAGWSIHPAVLDAALQVFGAALAGRDSGGTFLPVGMRRVRVSGRAAGPLRVHARVATGFEDAAMTREGDIRVYDASGSIVVDVRGLRLQQIEREARSEAADRPESWRYDTQWIVVEPGADRFPERQSWVVLGAREAAASAVGALQTAGARAVMLDCRRDATVAELQAALAAAPAHDAILCLWPLREATIDAGHATSRSRAAAIGPAVEGTEPVVAAHPPGNGSNGVKHTNGAHRAGDSNGSSPARVDEVLRELTDPALSVLHLIRAVAAEGGRTSPFIVVATRGGSTGVPGGDEAALAQAAVIGLIRAARIEHPELRLTVLDLDPAGGDDVGPPIVRLLRTSGEAEIADRDGAVEVRRLVPMGSPANPRPEAGDAGGPATEAAQPGDEVETAADLPLPVGPFRLEAASPGILDSLVLRPAARRVPARGEVEIEVEAAGLNFRDVMKALGIYPQPPGDLTWLGDEVAGRVVAVGDDVEFRVGDEVFGVAPAALASNATTRTDFLLRRPADLAAGDAVTLPIAFSTALYALRHLAHLQPGERVLIHAAAGGVGQAAIQIARAAGAEIFATASRGKHEFLRSLGVSHVFDSRSLSFAQGVRDATDGAGVDVVLNSLAGEFIPASIAVMAPYGRFVEIGKRDIFQNAQIGLWPFRNNLSYFAVDMDRVFRDRPQVARALLDELKAGLESGAFRPLPRTDFPITAAGSAFRYLAQARNVGKVVLTAVPVSADVAAADASGFRVRPDATYLVTGGTRGLGALVAEWLASRGARHLVLVGRDVRSGAAEETARRLEAAGASPTLIAADLGQPAAAAEVLRTIAATLPPLRGVVHCAGVLADAGLLNMDDDRFRSVFPAKSVAAVRLHRATRGLDLDFFIAFSSMASVLGNAGQANYAAANAVLDRLAWLRAGAGLPAQTINWGPWSEIGMSAASESQRMLSFGVRQIAPALGLRALDLVVDAPRPQTVVVSMDWRRFMATVPGAATDPLLAAVRVAGADREMGATSERPALLALEQAPPGERAPLLEAFVRAELAKVLQLGPEDLPLDQPLNTVGLDSLMALELKNRVESSLAITLPIVTLIQGPTISQLAVDLLARVESGDAAGATGERRSEELKEAAGLALAAASDDRPAAAQRAAPTARI